MKYDTNALEAERDRISNALIDAHTEVHRLHLALEKINVLLDLFSDPEPKSPPSSPGATLLMAVEMSCDQLIDGITRQRVSEMVRTMAGFSDAKENSVGAALATLCQTGHLAIVEPGKGRAPTYYTTHPGPMVVLLSEGERAALFSDGLTRGEGGWQNLMRSIQATANGPMLELSADLRKRIVAYMAYGGGGWQDKLRAIFGQTLSHLFHGPDRKKSRNYASP